MSDTDKDARPKAILKVLIVVLLVGAAAFVTFATKVMLPLRLLIGAIDVVAAAFLWLAMRQQSGGK